MAKCWYFRSVDGDKSWTTDIFSIIRKNRMSWQHTAPYILYEWWCRVYNTSETHTQQHTGQAFHTIKQFYKILQFCIILLINNTWGKQFSVNGKWRRPNFVRSCCQILFLQILLTSWDFHRSTSQQRPSCQFNGPQVWCVFFRFILWLIFCHRHCSDVHNILLHWTAL